MQSRRWCFTLNNPDKLQEAPPKELVENSVWGIWALEVAPQTGTRHVQGYTFLLKKRSLATVKALISPRAHVEQARGDHEQNRTYCRKGGKFVEFGTFPATCAEAGAAEGKKQKEAWEHYRELAKSGDFENIPAHPLITNYGNFKRFHQDCREPAKDLPPGTSVGVWLHGPSGVGKSHLARELYPDEPIYCKDATTKWWDNYRGESVVLLEDVHPEHAGNLHTHLKIWADRYAFQPEVKGSSAGYIRPRHVVVTSQYIISEVFRDARTRDAIERRFESRLVEHFTKRGRPDGRSVGHRPSQVCEGGDRHDDGAAGGVSLHDGEALHGDLGGLTDPADGRRGAWGLGSPADSVGGIEAHSSLIDDDAALWDFANQMSEEREAKSPYW